MFLLLICISLLFVDTSALPPDLLPFQNELYLGVASLRDPITNDPGGLIWFQQVANNTVHISANLVGNYFNSLEKGFHILMVQKFKFQS